MTSEIDPGELVERLTSIIATLDRRLSVVEGRSQLNAERIAQSHGALQDLSEDVSPLLPEPPPKASKKAKKAKAKPKPTEDSNATEATAAESD